ncbi:MAG: hypothetical protein AUH12_06045 [Gemmatimonadetes bacterium 13_2_20CM_69_8]|nr:MAG: hypothetical protein AUH12_06045 [Gemmatimonadetes bacterium 13_2_20CM_69_8]OLD95496.1 MAG: hypothetical protein AUG79_05110 [Gemmatimonadetes bacterium 13_1_20CM_4_69_16]
MRAFRLLAALLQLALPGAAAWADAELDAAGAHAAAHVESHTTSACTRIHPPDCALCHFLAAPFTARRPAGLRVAVAEARAARSAAPVRFRGAVARLLPPPRAPPALS